MRKTILLLSISFGLLVLTGAPLAGESIPGISPTEFGNVPVAAVTAMNAPEAHWIWLALTSTAVATAAAWVFDQIYKRVKNTRVAIALTAIRDAVTQCYHEYVRAVKAAHNDGKLTQEEKDNALRLALEKAIEIARTRGVDLLKIFAKETVVRLIERFIGESKAAGKGIPIPFYDFAPLPPSVTSGMRPA